MSPKYMELEDDDDLFAVLRARIAAEVEFDLGRRDADSLRRDEKPLIRFWSEAMATGSKRVELAVEAELVADAHGVPNEVEVTDVRPAA